jgi:2-aminophenol/2-amino-5-chlorophenol 1,6-dioxygenase beta subunit
MKDGTIIAGALAPHPPHLVYAANPPQNEPRAECGWEELRWGYDRLRASLQDRTWDVIVVHSPHWKTRTGHHVLAVPSFQGLSVDPIFPNLFRYHYDLRVDVELASQISQEARAIGLESKEMRNPDFRVDYGTIISCHLAHPEWNLPIVGLSSCQVHFDYSVEVAREEFLALGRATRDAIRKTGRRALLLASCSLSHRHFTEEAATPEDMSREHIYNHSQYLWDMRILEQMRQGRCRQIVDELPEYVEQSASEVADGSLTWLLGALDVPDYPATVHAYGTVIGTGNAIVEWDPRRAQEVQRG